MSTQDLKHPPPEAQPQGERVADELPPLDEECLALCAVGGDGLANSLARERYIADCRERQLRKSRATERELRETIRHYESNRMLGGLLPEVDDPMTANGLKAAMEYRKSCHCTICDHTRAVLTVVSRAETAEATVTRLEGELAAAHSADALARMAVEGYERVMLKEASRAEAAESALAAAKQDAADTIDLCRSLENQKLPCGHYSRYGHTDDGGKTNACTLCALAALRAEMQGMEWVRVETKS